jgi:phosphatidylinositol glycan class B
MNKISLFIKNPERVGLCLLILGHILAAYFSYGFHHPDEHFQILEFANYWIGISNDQTLLPWEFRSQIRPWFQPMIHGIFMKAQILLGIYNPFTTALLFRLFYAFLNIWGLTLLWGEFKTKWHLNPKWFLLLGLIWFFPYIHVRTSSENLSGIFLTFAFVYYFRTHKYFWTGILFGFAFLARYQIALGLFGFGLYLLIKDRRITKDQFTLLGAFLIPVGIGVVLDRLGYGNWVFTPYRYFKVNLVDGVAATFNPYPWYQYFVWILQLNPIVSLPLFFSCFLYLKRVKKDTLSFFIFSFFILHLFITNKEYRFLFPILNFVPFLSMIGFQNMESFFLSPRTLKVYGVVSVIAFSFSSLRGASVQSLWCLQMAHDYAKPGETWLSNHDYLDRFSRGYYHLSDHQLVVLNSKEDLENRLNQALPIKVLIDGHLQDSITRELLEIVERHQCKIITSAYPRFLFSLRGKLSMIDRLTYKAVFECND